MPNGQEQSQDVKGYQTQEGYVRGMMHQVDSSVIIYQLETDDMLTELEMSLKGYVWEPKEKKFIQKGERFMNDKGASILITLVKNKVHRTTFLSYYEDEDIRRIMEDFNDVIIEVLKTKYEEWEIDINYLSAIRNMLDDAIFSAYMRGLKGGEKQFLKGTEKRIETYAERDKQRSFLGGLGVKSKW